jgi:TATA-box binding protein (TBP) (component of TFIID and TFIIIB)
MFLKYFMVKKNAISKLKHKPDSDVDSEILSDSDVDSEILSDLDVDSEIIFESESESESESSYIESNLSSDSEKEDKCITMNDDIKIDMKGYDKLKQQLSEELRFELIPKEIYVSTITVVCSFDGIKFNCNNIARYVDISQNGIASASKDDGHSIQNGTNIIIKRSVLKDEKKNNKTKKKGFYNQVSLYVYIGSNGRDYIHVKLFTNGAIQMTGCRSVEDILKAITMIIKTLSVEKVVIENDKLEEKPFVNNIKYLNYVGVCNLGISMINSNFKISFNINLPRLKTLWDTIYNKDDCHFDKASHSCVNIKYDHPEKKISIFVFEKGAIVITGARNGEQIAVGYNFINKFLYANYKNIVKKDIVI